MPQTDVPGLPQLIVLGEAVGLVTGTLTVDSEPCSCGGPRRRDGHVSIKLWDLPRGREPTRLHLTAQRWWCPAGCAQPDPWGAVQARSVGGRRPRMTQRLLDELTGRHLRGAPASTLAAWCGVTASGLRPLLKQVTEERLARPRLAAHWAAVTHLGIDELFWQGRVLCVVVNLVSGELLDILPDREKDTLRAFLTEMNSLRPGCGAPVVATDMWLPYREVLREVYGAGLSHVCDRFHVQAKVGMDLRDAVRLILPASAMRPRQLRRVNEAFVQALRSGEVRLQVEGITAREREVLATLVELAVQAAGIWRSATVEEAQGRLSDWMWQRALTQLAFRQEGRTGQPFARLEYLLQAWREEILAYFDPACALPGGRRPSSGRVESANGRLRQLLRESWHARRRPYAATARDWDEQGQYERLWVRAMHGLNVAAGPPERLSVRLRPGVPPCPCGVPAERLAVTWSYQAALWDRPAGPHHVRAVAETAATRCPECRRRGRLRVDVQHGMTRALQADLREWRREGLSLRTLHRMTGVSAGRLRAATERALGAPAVRPPGLIGLQRWRWRGRDRWVVTDPEQGTLVDLLEGPEEDDFGAVVAELREWLTLAHRRGTTHVMVGDLAWAGHLPGPLTGLADRFTVMTAAHRALREVLWRVTMSLPVAARRAPELHRHRFVVLANPDRYRRLEDHLARPELLAKRSVLQHRFQAVQVATALVDELRTLFALTDEDALREALDTWLEQVDLHRTVEDTVVGARSLRFGFRDAAALLEEYRDAVVGGLHLQAARGLSLGASRRLLRSLNEHPAAAQGDFEFLRRSALYTLGGRP